MENIKKSNLIVIGGGPAGYSAAIRSAQLGFSVILIEKDALGGTCLNYGCIPTKFLWEAMHLEGKIKKAANFGLDIEFKGHNFSKIQQQKAKNIDFIGKGLKRLIESYPSIETISGTGRFLAPKKIEITLKDGSTLKAGAEKIIIAAGSRPKGLPGLNIDHDKIIDSTDALSLTEVPESMLIIGGGAIGVEMAAVFSGFGCEIHLIEREKQLLPGEDPELSEEAKKTLQRQRVKVTVGVESFEELVKDAKKVLVVTGRQPNIEKLDLNKAGVTYTKKCITVNEYLETSQKDIYCAGDIAGNCFLAYTAQMEGVAAAENAAGKKNTIDYSLIPRVVFTRPVLASAGAKGNDIDTEDISIGRFPLAANSRAFIEGERTGWIKIISEKKSGRIIGGQIIGPHADELITIVTMAMKNKMSVRDVSRGLFFHPSISESIHNACEDAQSKCVDLPKRV